MATKCSDRDSLLGRQCNGNVGHTGKHHHGPKLHECRTCGDWSEEDPGNKCLQCQYEEANP